MQDALSKVAGVSDVSVNQDKKLVVVKIEKGKITSDSLIKVIDGADPRFTASLSN